MSENTKAKYPKEWLERVPAQVFACLVPGELRIIVFPGRDDISGAAQWDVPVELIPVELRTPNTRLWLQLDDDMKILRVLRRED